MRVSGAVCVFVLSLCLAACGGGGSSNSGAGSVASSPGATPAAAVTPAEAATPTPEPTAGGTAAPTPTPTPDPNLLRTVNGTILRSYSPAALDGMNDGNLGNAADGIGSELPASAQPPFVFTFELPGVATITGFQADLRGQADNGPVPSVDFAVSTTSATDGFTDAGTISGKGTTLAANTKARWVRVTANQLYSSVGATGSIAPPPAALDPTGFFVEDANPDKNGGYVPTGTRSGNTRVRFVSAGDALVANECTATNLTGVYLGRFKGRHWNAAFSGNKDENPDSIRAVVNDDASIVAGVTSGGSSIYFSRTNERPAFCVARANGTGAHHVLVLDKDPIGTFAPSDNDPPVSGYTFDSIGAGMLDNGELNGHDTVILRQICNAPQVMAPEQQLLLLQWVAAGHKLIVGGQQCYNGSDFTWLPYPFTSAGPGPASQSNASLIQVENSALGTNDKNDAAHFVDVLSYVQDGNNSLGSSAAMTSTDPHWCGHFFVAKQSNVNGFVQTYAVDGTGLLIYDGFGENTHPTMQQIRQLELALPVPAGLPCTQRITDSFILEPSQEASFNAGSAQTIRVPMQVLANQGWAGTVSVKTSGGLPATVAPGSFNLAGGTQNLTVTIPIPASTKAGVYTVNVVADNGSGKTSQASIVLTGNESLKKEFTPAQRRIRIYGIHFDVASAVIQPQSQPVIEQIAQIMRENPGLRFQVQGHTDSDGGAAYNLALSQRRAQSVVNDLVTRYGIARSRLVAKGYGLTEPVASNATDAGKALNRRVELLRL